jgi:LmbE family N-acetylglucosaminyl deacetylase
MNAAGGNAKSQPEYERVLRVVEGSGAHGQLTDVRDVLKSRLSQERPLVMLCPHADDGAITAACLLHEYAVNRGFPVIEVLLFSGERNVDAPWLTDRKKVSVRENEFRLECEILGTEPLCWDLEAYRTAGYRPTRCDVEKVVSWFNERRPGALILPPATDAHLGHRMTRALGAIGILGARLKDVLILTGWTPWGPIARPNAYFPYDAEAERAKEWAVRCHASQLLLTDYAEFTAHLGRAYAALTREWSEGHALSSRSLRVDMPYVGVELYQIETYEPAQRYLSLVDPVQVALGILAGDMDPKRAEVLEDPAKLAGVEG